MLTIFACPKLFSGHIGIIQRSAIQNWLQLLAGNFFKLANQNATI